jgi:hypothetical protein
MSRPKSSEQTQTGIWNFLTELFTKSKQPETETKKNTYTTNLGSGITHVRLDRGNIKDFTNMPNRFLRVFNGHMTPSYSYGRFPCNQLEKVQNILKFNGFTKNLRIGCWALESFASYNKSCNNFLIRRKNGESHWNITHPMSDEIHGFEGDMMRDLFKLLKDNDVDLDLPQIDLEYIQPQTEEDSYRFQKFNAYEQTDNNTIQKFLIMQGHEEELNEKIKGKSQEERLTINLS